jgi:serine/threonine protein kinase
MKGDPASRAQVLDHSRTVASTPSDARAAVSAVPHDPRSAREDLLGLALSIKEELRRRFARGDRPAVSEYLERFPELRADRERILSLLYEEYCLREEAGDAIDPEQFCQRYGSWRDSLASQLRYHRELSQMVSLPRRPVRFPEPGERILWFSLERILGSGGAGRVFLARDATLGGKRLALKLASDRSEEASLQGRLDHPHIMPVTLVEHDPETDLRVLCMPYYSGLPLTTVIERVHDQGTPRHASALWMALGSADDAEPGADPPRPDWNGFPARGSFADAAAWVILKLAEALAYAHGRGVSHRDIKPANILLTRRAGPQLLDFNLAHAPCDGRAAATAATGGTLPYMAPEHLAAFLDPARWDDVQPSADLYSLGLVLRELLTGQRPPVPDPRLPTPRAIAELLDQRQSTTPLGARLHNRHVPHALDAILTRCLAPRPAERYPGAAALAEDLRCYLARLPLRLAVNPSRRERAANWAYRRRWPLASSACCTGAVLFALAFGGSEPIEVRANQLLDQATDSLNHERLLEARKRYESLVELAPDWYKAHQGMGALALREKHRLDKRVKELLAAGRTAEARNLANDVPRLLRECEASYTKALALAASDRGIHESQIASLCGGRATARVLLGLEYQRQAAAQCDRSSGQPTQTPGSRARYEQARRCFHDALADLRTAIKIDVDQTDFHVEIHVARACLGLGDVASSFNRYDESAPYFQAALDHATAALDRADNPGFETEARQLIRILKERYAHDEAERRRSGKEPIKLTDVP